MTIDYENSLNQAYINHKQYSFLLIHIRPMFLHAFRKEATIIQLFSMIQSEEDKRLVDQYKQTNVALRKQLLNLNTEIDKILTRKSNQVGLQKMPSVSKKITDPQVIQQEVQNLRKRAELLEVDSENYKNKALQNYHQKIRETQTRIQQAENEMQQCKKTIKQLERKDKIANVQAAKAQNTNKWEKRISALQEQISRYQKMEKDLVKELNYQAASDNKTNNLLSEMIQKHQQAISKRQVENSKKPLLPPVVNVLPASSISEQEWKQLKMEFLQFKESKQKQQWMLNEQNERLRAEMQDWQRKIKEKKKRLQVILSNEQKNRGRQSRVYSTLEQGKPNKQPQGYRYRDRNNSVQYNSVNTKQ